MGIFELYAMYRKVKEALAKGDLATLAMIGGDLLHAAAKLLPNGKTVEVATPDLMPLKLPGGFDLDKLITLIQLFKSIFGK